MIDKGALYNMNGWSQFFFFCFLAFSGYLLAILFLVLCFDIEGLNQSADAMRAAMAVQSVCLFLLPSLAFAHFCQYNPKVYLGTEPISERTSTFLLLSILLIIVIQPVINSISYYNQQLVLPESMSSIEEWMREAEQSAEQSLNLLFVDKSAIGLIFNLFVLAVIAGLTEEFFFRGCLQQIIQKIVTNRHAAVWITAFIFSAIHMQFYGFIPRLLLGALLGYLFVWSRNIWIPVLVHTVHNALNVILTYIFLGTPEYEQMENFSLGQNVWFILPGFILSAFILYIIHRKRPA